MASAKIPAENGSEEPETGDGAVDARFSELSQKKTFGLWSVTQDVLLDEYFKKEKHENINCSEFSGGSPAWQSWASRPKSGLRALTQASIETREAQTGYKEKPFSPGGQPNSETRCPEGQSLSCGGFPNPTR